MHWRLVVLALVALQLLLAGETDVWVGGTCRVGANVDADLLADGVVQQVEQFLVGVALEVAFDGGGRVGRGAAVPSKTQCVWPHWATQSKMCCAVSPQPDLPSSTQ